MPVASMSPNQERLLCQYCWVINTLIDTYGILSTTLVAASTTVDDLIARTYAALVSGNTSLFGTEAKLAVREFEQGVRLMETLGLLNTTIVGALLTVNTAALQTDLRYIITSVLSDTTLDVTKDWDIGCQLGMSASITS